MAHRVIPMNSEVQHILKKYVSGRLKTASTEQIALNYAYHHLSKSGFVCDMSSYSVHCYQFDKQTTRTSWSSTHDTYDTYDTHDTTLCCAMIVECTHPCRMTVHRQDWCIQNILNVLDIFTESESVNAFTIHPGAIIAWEGEPDIEINDLYGSDQVQMIVVRTRKLPS